MKTPLHSGFCPLTYFSIHKKTTRVIAYILIILLSHLVTACSYYNVHDVVTQPETLGQQIETLNKEKPYAVMHSPLVTWHLENITLNEYDKTMSGTVAELTAKHITEKPRETKRVHAYSQSKASPFNELHFYLEDIDLRQYGSPITIPFSAITKISVNDKNTGRSIANAFLGVIGVLAIATIVVALTKSSCPYIYVQNGDNFVFTGELYPGVLTENQQRDDYIKLPEIFSENDDFNVKISNELKEVQYTDLVQLIEVIHPKDIEVLMDSDGTPYSIKNPQAPKQVLIDQETSNIIPAMEKDENSYLFNTNLNTNKNTRQVELSFEKPLNATQAKLVLTLKNSLWLDYVFGKFNALFGTYFPEFQKKQAEYTREENTNWINSQHLPLAVYVKNSTGWELVQRIQTVGPMATRDIVVPIDLTKIQTKDLEIKLETGFMFWEVDYTAVDYSSQDKLEVNYINPFQAIDQNHQDVTPLLLESEGKYLVQPNVGDAVTVSFKTNTSSAQMKASYFLKNRGYYTYIRDYKTKPNLMQLKVFKEAEAFTEYSRLEYAALMDYESQFDLVSK
ncbi:hypothetical protein [Formosa sp. S-31]|uniref:hypothetical protein n=1 Tax=Formosa sp. S-31 TaxID=2790949 RepID=UPI003EBCCBA5